MNWKPALAYREWVIMMDGRGAWLFRRGQTVDCFLDTHAAQEAVKRIEKAERITKQRRVEDSHD